MLNRSFFIFGAGWIIPANSQFLDPTFHGTIGILSLEQTHKITREAIMWPYL